ncbi:MAG: TatD family hydrolase [Lachnospiraceae bacterium]|nr:TatD family hydrolase [Lachnospiraceae bacterium]
MIFDSHAHYDDEAFENDYNRLLEEMPQKGIGHVCDVGASMESSQRALLLAQTYPYVYAAVGIHPEHADTLENGSHSLEELRAMASHEKVVAIGEIGLDYHYEDNPSPEVQQKWFRQQIRLAKEVKLPIIIHSRDAAADTFAIMKEENAKEAGGVLHCYSYSAEMARQFLAFDFYFGFGGVVTFKNAKKAKQAVEAVPLDHILLETDCPYMAPEPHRGERNSSLFLPHIARAIGEIKGISTEEVIRVTEENAFRMFGIETP